MSRLTRIVRPLLLAGAGLLATFFLTGHARQAQAAAPPGGPGGPILVVTTPANPFSYYYAEILRSEGFNAFAVMDLGSVSPASLAPYDLVILGEMALSASEVDVLSDWVTAGGNLIAMRPDKQLGPLFGLADVASTLSEGYVLVDTAAAPGSGIVGQTMQYHGVADRYTVIDATSVATLYFTASAPTANPAVTVRS